VMEVEGAHPLQHSNGFNFISPHASAAFSFCNTAVGNTLVCSPSSSNALDGVADPVLGRQWCVGAGMAEDATVMSWSIVGMPAGTETRARQSKHLRGVSLVDSVAK
jgi:hypothetical protein